MKKVISNYSTNYILLCDASENPPYVYGAKCDGFANMIIMADRITMGSRTFKCYDYNNLTDGGGYYKIFNAPTLADIINRVWNRGGEVFQFESLREFVDWAEKA